MNDFRGYGDVRTMQAGREAIVDQEAKRQNAGNMAALMPQVDQSIENAYVAGRQRGGQQGRRAGLAMSQQAQEGMSGNIVDQGIGALVQGLENNIDPRETLQSLQVADNVKQMIAEGFQQYMASIEQQAPAQGQEGMIEANPEMANLARGIAGGMGQGQGQGQGQVDPRMLAQMQAQGMG